MPSIGEDATLWSTSFRQRFLRSPFIYYSVSGSTSAPLIDNSLLGPSGHLFLLTVTDLNEVTDSAGTFVIS